MLKKQLLTKKTLITVDEVVQKSTMTASPEAKTILQSIELAEARFIVPLIGNYTYDLFRNQKNVYVNSVNKDYIEGLFAEEGKIVILKIGELINSIDFVSQLYLKNFWNEILWKLTAECVVYVSSPENYSRYEASGEMINNPQTLNLEKGSVSVDLKTLMWKMDKMLMDRIDPLVSLARSFMIENSSYFSDVPFIQKNATSQSGIAGGRKTGFIHIYDNERRNNC